jgi:hypothetical protein
MFYFAVLTYNRAESLQALLKSILDLKLPAGADFKIFIFDNASAGASRTLSALQLLSSSKDRLQVLATKYLYAWQVSS